MNAVRSNAASSDAYVTRKRRGVGELFLQEAAGRLLTGLADRVEDKVAESVKKKTKTRIVETRRQLEDVLRDGRAEHHEEDCDGA